MNVADHILSVANQKNPIQGALLSVCLDGGRVVCTGPRVEALLSLVPEHIVYEKRDIKNSKSFEEYGAKDLIFVEEDHVDALWQLARTSGAQVALMTDSLNEASLMDIAFSEGDLRSALLDIGALAQQLSALKGQINLEGSRLNKALFLDRDGVLIENTGYINDPESVKILPGVIEGLKEARDQGYLLIMISNQSGIGRGMIQWAQYEKVQQRMFEKLSAAGIYFDRSLRSAFYQNSQFASGLVRRSLRKPRPGMIHSVVSEFRIDLSQSLLIGDSACDLQAGALAGIQKLYLMESPKLVSEESIWNNWPLKGRALAEHCTVKKIKNLSQALS